MNHLHSGHSIQNSTVFSSDITLPLYRWTGSNRNPGKNAGQGKAGTDRSNVILLEEQVFDEGKPKQSITFGHFGRNYPENLNDDRILGFSMVDSKKLAFLQPGL